MNKHCANYPRYSCNPVVTCAYGYKGSFIEEITVILFLSTAL